MREGVAPNQSVPPSVPSSARVTHADWRCQAPISALAPPSMASHVAETCPASPQAKMHVSPMYGPQQTPPQVASSSGAGPRHGSAHGGTGHAHVPLVHVHTPQISGHCAPSTAHLPVRLCGQLGGEPESPPLEPPSEAPPSEKLPEPLSDPEPPPDEDDAASVVAASTPSPFELALPQLADASSAGRTIQRVFIGCRTSRERRSWPAVCIRRTRKSQARSRFPASPPPCHREPRMARASWLAGHPRRRPGP